MSSRPPSGPRFMDFEGRVVRCDLSRAPADAVTVDFLAQLKLAAQRSGWQLVVAGASRGLRELLVFSGLEELLVEAIPARGSDRKSS